MAVNLPQGPNIWDSTTNMVDISGAQGTTTISGIAGGLISGNGLTHQTDSIIKGEMMAVYVTMSDIDYAEQIVDPMQVKEKLMEQLVQSLFKNKKIEFTKLQDFSTGEHKFTARIFVVPDTQVRILREKGYDAIARNP